MLAVPVGLLASAILVVNNVRDLETDRRAGKRTLAVRLGRERARGAVRRRWSRARSSPRRCRGSRLAVAVAAPVAGWRSRSRCRSSRIVRTRTDGPSLNGALAATGQLAARVLRAALRGAARELTMARSRSTPVAAARCATPLAPPGASCASASCCRCGWTSATATTGVGEAAPLEPYDGVLARRRARRRSTPTARSLRDAGPRADARRAAGGLRGGARPARRRSPRSTSRSGTAPGGAPGAPVAQLLAAGAAARGARSTRRSAPSDRAGAAAAAAAAARAGFGCVKVKVGRRRRRGPGRRGARGGRAGRWRSGSTRTARGRRRRGAARTCARSRPPGSSTPRSRSTASTRCAAVRARRRRARSRWTRRPRSRARGVGRADAVCLKVAPLRRDHRAAARRARSPARPGARSTWRRRSTGRSGSRPGCTRRRRWPPAVRCRGAGWRRWARSTRRRRRCVAGRAARSRCRRARACWASTALELAPIRRSVVERQRQQLDDRVGRLEVGRVAGAGDDASRSRAAARPPSSPRSRGTSRRARRRRGRRGRSSSASRSHSDGIDAGAEPAQRGGEARRGVAAGGPRAASSATPRGMPANSGCALPLGREGLDPDRLDPVGERRVGTPRAPRARRRRRCPGSRRSARAARRARRAPSAACSATRPPIE